MLNINRLCFRYTIVQVIHCNNFILIYFNFHILFLFSSSDGTDINRSNTPGLSSPRTMNSVPHRPPLPYMGMHNPYLHGFQSPGPYSQPFMNQGFMSPYRYGNPQMRMSFPLQQRLISPTQSTQNMSSPEHSGDHGDHGDGDTPLHVRDLEGEEQGRDHSDSPTDNGNKSMSFSPAASYRPPMFSPLYNPYLHPPMHGNWTGMSPQPQVPVSSPSATRPEDQAHQNAMLMAELETERSRNKRVSQRYI